MSQGYFSSLAPPGVSLLQLQDDGYCPGGGLTRRGQEFIKERGDQVPLEEEKLGRGWGEREWATSCEGQGQSRKSSEARGV